ncbi:tetratricopeptide repeat protein [candidate division CSSED10-310 bacterium]|uniref:Tetratricopeptide repeat protein n=1 Tax=candidate division CSSED10-310 bacterium TaxID=2855610 RepID=A0ABV6YWQ7_UNCC1
MHMALSRFTEALTTIREVGDRREEGIILCNFAQLHYEQGNVERACELHDQALNIMRQIGERAWEGWILCLQASLLRLCFGDLEQALKLLSAAKRIINEVGEIADVIRCICERGHIALATAQTAQHQIEEARQVLVAFDAEPGSIMDKSITGLERAQAAFEAQEPHRLFRGELSADIAPKLKQWLRNQGMLEKKLTGS